MTQSTDSEPATCAASCYAYDVAMKPFYGVGPPEDPIRWLRDFENSARRNCLTSDAQKLQAVGRYLEDYAGDWWGTVSTKVTFWQCSEHVAFSFHHLFLLRFVPTQLVECWKRQVRQAQWGRDESIINYTWRIRELYCRISYVEPGFESEAVKCLIDGLCAHHHELDVSGLQWVTSFSDLVPAVERLAYTLLSSDNERQLQPALEASRAPVSRRCLSRAAVSDFMPSIPGHVVGSGKVDTGIASTFGAMTLYNAVHDVSKTPGQHSQGDQSSLSSTITAATLAAMTPIPVSLRPANTRVFFDIQIGKSEVERMVMELFDDVVPRTARNFRNRCANLHGFGFKGSDFYHINEKEHWAWADCTKSSTDTASNVGDLEKHHFIREASPLKHNQRGILSMHGDGTQTKKSTFFICLQPLPQCDEENKYTVFGRVTSGMQVLDLLEDIGSVDGKPLAKASIIKSGIW